uniref:Nardilysin n=2 Tax=Photinus pyralis TaxID=7054 RepID=A0A1Y1M428_PHOPY
MVRLWKLNLYYSLFSNFKRQTQTMRKSTFKKGKPGKAVGKPKVSQTKINFKVLEPPTKSANDKKDYKVIQLQNGLTACLISDVMGDDDSDSSDDSGSETDETVTTESEVDSDSSDSEAGTKSKSSDRETKMAGAALCVGVGSMSDPREIPGLAHFLEHMVFMGSEKYPEENDFDSFISKHGGFNNASTDYEVTTFHFECFEKHLPTALHKLAQFFISPLMKRDSMTREREAVESEFQLAVPSDDFRKEQLIVSMAQDSSPVNSFSWGNLITLKDNVSDDRLYEMLHEFRKRHYSAHRMTVAIQARLPIATLEKLLVDCFSPIPNNGLPPDDFKTLIGDTFDTPKFRQLYYVKPVKDICQVDLTFYLPSLIRLYRVKPHVYLSWILGYEGKNSLYSYLKKKVWVLSLSAANEESGAEYNSIYATFTISLVLTREGFSNIKDVVESVFSYINLLKINGPSERIFREMQSIGETSFRFEEEETAADNVEDLVEHMQYFPSKDYLTGDTLVFDYDPDAITMVLNNLVPTKMNVMISSADVPTNIVYDQIEPWFKTQYKAIDIPSDWLECWKNAKPLPEFSLPGPNPFVTTDFSILPKQKNLSKYPEKVLDSPLIELWYRKDDKFELPLAYYYYYLISPLALKSAASTCMMEMYAILVQMNFAEEGYDALLADLEFEIIAGEKGLAIKISGYNEKLNLLIELVGKCLKNVSQTFSEPLFDAIKEKLRKSYYNAIIKPSKLCKDLRLSVLQQNYFSHAEKHRATFAITYDQMRQFSDDVLKNLYVQGLVQGNVTSATALDATKSLLCSINPSPLGEADRPKIIINELPLGEHCCRIESINEDNSNSVITNYYQCGISHIKNTVILELILLLVEEPLFDTLRTKEQLGYKVDCSLRDTYGILGYTVSVSTQANKYTTQHVDARIENYLEQSQGVVMTLSEKKFQRAKKDLIKVKQCVDVDLEDEIDRNWDEIVNCKYKFNRLLLEIKAIESLKMQEVKNFWKTHNMGQQGTHKKLSMQVVGHPPKVVQDATDDPKEVSPLKVGKIRAHGKAHHSKSPLNTFSEDTNCDTSASNLSIKYLQDLTEIAGNRTESYFIEDIESFKKSLKPFQ